MTTFIAIYRGSTVTEAQLIAVSADPSLVADVSGRLLRQSQEGSSDPVISRVEQGRRAALRIVNREAKGCPVE